jgi:subtilisin family serine protease
MIRSHICICSVRPVRRALIALVAISVLLSAGPADAQKAVNAPLGQADIFGGHASTHVIIRVKQGFAPIQLVNKSWTLQRDQQRDAKRIQGDALAVTAARYRVSSIEPAFMNQPANQVLAEKYGLNRYYKVNVPRGTDTPKFAAELGAFVDAIEIAEVDGVGGIAAIPNDSSFNNQWNMHNVGQNGGTVDADVDAPEAWDLTTGDANIVVAVLDTGVQADHPELAGRVTLAPPTYICPTVPPDPPCTATDSYDMHGHGTHCAGVIAAAGNNGAGVAGMNWNCQIMAIRVVHPTSGGGSELPVADGVIYATDNGADIISMSLQYYGAGTTALQNAVAYAYDSGVLPIAAAGNFAAAGTVAYPAKYPKCMAIAATNKLDVRYSGSNTGPELDVAAPGQDLYSLWKNSGYMIQSGTSMATPHVSGLASLIRSINPALTVPEIESILKNTVDDKGPVGFDTQYGWGRINAHAALVAATPILECEGELTGDEVVDVDDLLLVINGWGNCPAPPASCTADFMPEGGNGMVDVDDLLGVLIHWGPCP